LLSLGIADAFQPCKGVAAAARLIELFSRYNTGSPTRGIANGYARSVLTAIRAVKAASATPAPIPAPVQSSMSAPYPFARPSPTGRDLVFATVGK
jgi:hypothetical protein